MCQTLFSCITRVSLPVDIDPHLGDHTQTRNLESPNKNGHKQTRLNLREELRQDCKTFTHLFDSEGERFSENCATNRVTKGCENGLFGVNMCRVESQLNY